MFIRSERLFLRPAWPEDRDEIAGLPGGMALADAILRDGAAGRGHMHLLVTLPTVEDHARVIGAVTLRGDACLISPGFRRRGYAREAARAARQASGALGFSDDSGMKKAA